MSKQTDRVKDYLEKFGSITPLEAKDHLCIMRLASRMSELKKEGYPFKRRGKTVKNKFGEKCHVAEYYIKKDGEKECSTQ